MTLRTKKRTAAAAGSNLCALLLLLLALTSSSSGTRRSRGQGLPGTQREEIEQEGRVTSGAVKRRTTTAPTTTTEVAAPSLSSAGTEWNGRHHYFYSKDASRRKAESVDFPVLSLDQGRVDGDDGGSLSHAAAPPEEDGEEEEVEGPIEEPPVLRNEIPKEWVRRCANFNKSAHSFEDGAVCGPPLSEPCFDHGRCGGASASPKVYVFDEECSLSDSSRMPISDHTNADRQHQSSYWREAVWMAGMLAETYEEACLFIHVNTHNHDEPCATRTPLWNGGVNHIMMEFTPWWNLPHSKEDGDSDDTGRDDHDRPSISNTYAMDWAFDSLSCYYRSGFDLSLPLVPGKVFPELASTPPRDRDYFLTFKGTLYLRGHGIEERSAVSRMHDPTSGIVSVIRCSDLHGEELLPENRDYCERSAQRYRRYDYGRLMNTTFGLVPAGRSPGTFRLGEVMSAGAIPVFVVRDWIKPFQEQIDWPSFSFVFSPGDVGPTMLEVLRAVQPEELREMQRKSLEAYWHIFGGVTDYSVIAANSIALLRQRFRYH